MTVGTLIVLLFVIAIVIGVAGYLLNLVPREASSRKQTPRSVIWVMASSSAVFLVAGMVLAIRTTS